MATPDDFRRTVLGGLYKDAQMGRGTDLDVIVPASSDGDEAGLVGGMDALSPTDGNVNNKTFHLHHNIVSASSKYFATFPEPKSGRTISDADSESVEVCIRFMYTGEYTAHLSHANVASVLHASELLQINDLSKKCIDYLEQNLDHDNYELVVELADRFNSPELKKIALRFQTKNSARDKLLSKRVLLVRDIGIAKYDEKGGCKRRTGLERQLYRLEQQLNDIFQKQREQELLSEWGKSKTGDEAFKTGSVGHLVCVQPLVSKSYCDSGSSSESESEDYYYSGSSTYGDAVDVSQDERLPPPPSKERYEKYGIINSHDSITTAIAAASPGDRIYLAPGSHDDSGDSGNYKIVISKPLDIIGLSSASKRATVEIDYDEHECFSVLVGPVSFNSIMFRARANNCEKEFDPDCAQGTGDDAIISFEEGTGGKPLRYQEMGTADFVVKNCSFDLGDNCANAYPTRVSGIALKRGKSAHIEGCTFLGGAGSAIVAVNDPFLYTPDVRIIRNTFVNNGQPIFAEVSVKQENANKGRYKRAAVAFVPIPAHKITPGPACVELWKVNRKLFYIKELGQYEQERSVSINLTENRFESNLRTPFAYRALCQQSRKLPLSRNTLPNTWQLHDDLPDGGSILSSSAKGFILAMSNNVFQNNGLQLDTDSVSRMKDSTSDTEMNTEDEEAQPNKMAFPDGNTLLVIDHYIEKSDKESFPGGDGGPNDYFYDDYCEWDADY